MRQILVSLLVASVCLFLTRNSSIADEPVPANLPVGYKLVYKQSFDDDSSLKDFQFSDSAAWRWTKSGKSGGAIELFQQSLYKTEHRSPFNLAMLSDKIVGDFVLELDMRQTGKEYGHRDMCLYFGFQNAKQFYYTHLATTPDPNANNIFIVNNAPRKSFLEVPKKGVDWSDDWKRIRVQRAGAEIKVFFEDMKTPVLQGTHSVLGAGYIGFGSFDDTGIMDNLQLWSNSVQEQPAKLFPK
jgi:hypothetical protein